MPYEHQQHPYLPDGFETMRTAAGMMDAALDEIRIKSYHLARSSEVLNRLRYNFIEHAETHLFDGEIARQFEDPVDYYRFLVHISSDVMQSSAKHQTQQVGAAATAVGRLHQPATVIAAHSYSRPSASGPKLRQWVIGRLSRGVRVAVDPHQGIEGLDPELYVTDTVTATHGAESSFSIGLSAVSNLLYPDSLTSKHYEQIAIGPEAIARLFHDIYPADRVKTSSLDEMALHDRRKLIALHISGLPLSEIGFGDAYNEEHRAICMEQLRAVVGRKAVYNSEILRLLPIVVNSKMLRQQLHLFSDLDTAGLDSPDLHYDLGLLQNVLG